MNAIENHYRSSNTKLPIDFARLNTLGLRKRDSLIFVRDERYYDEVYRYAWNTLLMQIDRPNQSLLMESLRETVTTDPSRNHRDPISAYWASLEASSSYPDFLAVKNDAQLRGDIMKTVASFGSEQNRRRVGQLAHIDPVTTLYPNLYSGELMAEAFGADTTPQARNNRGYSRAFFEQLSELGGNSMHTYASALMLLSAARDLSLHILFDQIDQFARSNDPKDPFKINITNLQAKLSYVFRRTEPFLIVSKGLAKGIARYEEELFGDEAEFAGQLWRSTIHLRSKNLPTHIPSTAIREKPLLALIDRNYQLAKLELEELLTKYPKLMPQFAIRELGLDPEGLIRLKQQIENAESEKAKAALLMKRQEESEIIRLINTKFYGLLASDDHGIEVNVQATSHPPSDEDEQDSADLADKRRPANVFRVIILRKSDEFEDLVNSVRRKERDERPEIRSNRVRIQAGDLLALIQLYGLKKVPPMTLLSRFQRGNRN